jgi:putative transposase
MQDASAYRRGRSVASALHVHLVFTTEYRRGVLDEEAIRVLRDVFAGVCAAFGADLRACDGEDDHVHLLVEYPPAVSVSGLVTSLKGVSSRMLRKLRPQAARRYRQGVLWSPSYFAASAGGAPLDAIRRYVEQQRSPG